MSSSTVLKMMRTKNPQRDSSLKIKVKKVQKRRRRKSNRHLQALSMCSKASMVSVATDRDVTRVVAEQKWLEIQTAEELTLTT